MLLPIKAMFGQIKWIDRYAMMQADFTLAPMASLGMRSCEKKGYIRENLVISVKFIIKFGHSCAMSAD